MRRDLTHAECLRLTGDVADILRPLFVNAESALECASNVVEGLRDGESAYPWLVALNIIESPMRSISRVHHPIETPTELASRAAAKYLRMVAAQPQEPTT